MGGGGSKYEPVETEAQRPAIPYKVKGLKPGDVITARGEAFAGVDKLIAVRFFSGKDVALLFKAYLLPSEGLYNIIKLNYMENGKWGPEEKKENVIYLNHHFVVNFTCLQDKFRIDINGKHFADFKHHLTPDTIDVIYLAGDANWKPLELPNAVPHAVEYSGELQLPSPEEVNQFIQTLRHSGPVLTAAPNADDGKQLEQLITEGLEVTKKLLGDPEPTLWGDIVRIGGYLRNVYSAGTAVWALYKFLDGIGKDTDMTVLKKKLDEISLKLTDIDKSIQQGFANLIEHMDYAQFRELVQIRVTSLFDMYTRCYSVNGKLPIQEFKKMCSEKQSPRNVFSDMYGFLLTDNNIIKNNLKTTKYVYSVWEGWSNVFYNNAIKLIVMNMFYYGIICEEHSVAGNTDILIDKEEEIKNLIEQVRRMRDRLQEIEENRMKTFHKDGYVKEFLTERFKKVRFQKPNENIWAACSQDLPLDSLPKIAYQLKKSWMNFNGPSDFYITVIRGKEIFAKERVGLYRYSGLRNFDPERVTVITNIGHASEFDWDTFCVALIQPVTKKIRDANEKFVKENTEKMKEVSSGCYSLPPRTLDKVAGYLASISLKPLLIICSTHETKVDRNEVRALPVNYLMGSEAWSSPGGPLPLKFFTTIRGARCDDCCHQFQYILQ